MATLSVEPAIIMYENVLANIAQIVVDLIAGKWKVVYSGPYSSDLSICEFDLIPKMRELIRCICFHTVSKILQAVDRTIRKISRIGNANSIPQRPNKGTAGSAPAPGAIC